MRMQLSLLAAMAGCTLAMTACAAEVPYNPDNLGAEQLGRVTQICQKVLGLSPNEPLEGGYWMGNDRLDYYTNHYRGCITSLSDSLRSVLSDQATQQADADCRARGLQPGSPDLALCVLGAINDRPRQPVQTAAVTATPVSDNLPQASGSFFYAAPHENVRREQIACAALGFEPSQAGFKSCVKGLDDTFYSIDHPIN